MTILALMAVLAVGCNGAPSAPAGDNVNFRLFISDELNEIRNFQSVNVTITQFGLKHGGESGNWTTFNITPPETVDLTTEVENDATAIWIGEVPTGNYTKVFIYTENVTGVLNSENVTVKLPNNKLQISKPFVISEDLIVDFVFDITVIKAGNSGKYILKPQIAESGANQSLNDVTPKVKTKGPGKPEDAGKPENVGKPE